MAVGFSNTNKPLNPRGQDASPKGYNRAKLFSGKALDFDGVSDQITFGTISDLTFGTGDFSAVLDWQIDSVSAYSWAIAKNPSLDFGIGINNTGGLLRLWIGGTLSLGTENILGSDWKKIAVVRESGVVSAYINGVAISLTETAMAGSIDSGDLFVGSWPTNADFWNGLLNNIRLFNTALTAAQVADLYNNPEKVVPTGVDNTALKLWLPMQEGAGTTAYDGSGNGNHGTISGATYVNGVGAPVSQTAVIDWNKGTNLLQYSEDFVTGFSISNAVVSQANITAPDGSNLVRKLVATNANTFHLTLQGVTQSAGIYTQSVYAKAEGRDFLYMNTRVDGGSNRYGVKFNIANGTYVDDATSGSPTNTSYSIQNMGNGWFRCIISIQHTSGSVVSVFSPAIAGAVNGINDGHQGDGVNGIYIWGGALSQSTIPQPYVYTGATAQPNPVLLPAGLTTGRDITGVNLFENVRKQGALNLDGNSWAEVHDNASLDITSAITLEAWVKWDTSQNNKGILGRYFTTGNNRSTMLVHHVSGVLRFYTSADGSSTNYVTNTQTLTNGEWYHIVGTSDGSTNKIYVNAQTPDSDTGSSIIAVDIPLEIGRYNQDPTYSYQQPIAQPRIYNRALTAAEVLQNYNSGKNTYK